MLTATLFEPKVSLYQSYLGKAYYQAEAVPRRARRAADREGARPARSDAVALHEPLRARPEPPDRRARRRCVGPSRSTTTAPSIAAGCCSIATRRRPTSASRRSTASWDSTSWGAAEALNSVETDLTNASAHLFLGETYGLLPDRTQALSSELLQYFLYAPVNRNSFNTFSEYTALLEQPYASFSLVGGLGEPGRSRATAITRSGNDTLAHYAFVEQNREDGARPDEPTPERRRSGRPRSRSARRATSSSASTRRRNVFGQDRESVQAFGLDTGNPDPRAPVPERARPEPAQRARHPRRHRRVQARVASRVGLHRRGSGPATRERASRTPTRSRRPARGSSSSRSAPGRTTRCRSPSGRSTSRCSRRRASGATR